MSSELYSRTFSDPRCTVSTVKEGTLLCPHVPTNMPRGWEVGRHSKGRSRAALSRMLRGKHGLCSQRYLGLNPGSIFYLLCDVRQVTLLP